MPLQPTQTNANTSKPTGPVAGFSRIGVLTPPALPPQTHIFHRNHNHRAEPGSGPYGNNTSNDATPAAAKRHIEVGSDVGSSLPPKKTKYAGFITKNNDNNSPMPADDKMQCERGVK